MKKKIVVTGGSGRFASELKKIKTDYKVIYPSKKHLDITSYKKIKNYFKKIKQITLFTWLVCLDQ